MVNVSHASTVWAPAVLYPCLRRPGRETDPSPPSSVEVKNEWPCVCLSNRLHGLHDDSFAWQVPSDNETRFLVPPASVYLPILICVQRSGRWFDNSAKQVSIGWAARFRFLRGTKSFPHVTNVSGAPSPIHSRRRVRLLCAVPKYRMNGPSTLTVRLYWPSAKTPLIGYVIVFVLFMVWHHRALCGVSDLCYCNIESSSNTGVTVSTVHSLWRPL